MDQPKIVLLEAVLMPNGEVIHYGKSLGWVGERQMSLVESGAHKIAKGNEPIVALRMKDRKDNAA